MSRPAPALPISAQGRLNGGLPVSVVGNCVLGRNPSPNRTIFEDCSHSLNDRCVRGITWPVSDDIPCDTRAVSISCLSIAGRIGRRIPMKSQSLIWINAVALFAILALPAGIGAQDLPTQKLPFYSVTDLGTLGGAFSVGVGINTRGLITLNASTAGNAAQHVAIWRSGNKTDLDTLGGPNSNTFWRPTVAAVVTGFSDTSTPDPLGTD